MEAAAMLPRTSPAFNAHGEVGLGGGMESISSAPWNIQAANHHPPVIGGLGQADSLRQCGCGLWTRIPALLGSTAKTVDSDWHRRYFVKHLAPGSDRCRWSCL